MKPLRAVLVAIAVATVTLSGCAVAHTRVPATASLGKDAKLAASSSQAQRYYRTGPSESCDGDACGVGVVQAVRITTPNGGPTTIAVSISTSYRTTGRAVFAISASARSEGKLLRVLPGYRRVHPSSTATADTQTFLVTHVAPGVQVTVWPNVRILGRGGTRQSISLHKTVLTVACRR